MREAPIRHLKLLARSEAEIQRHASLLSRRPNVHAVSLLRWSDWKYEDSVRLLSSDTWERAADAALESLTAALRTLIVSEFGLTQGTLGRLGRYAADPVTASQDPAGQISCVALPLNA